MGDMWVKRYEGREILGQVVSSLMSTHLVRTSVKPRVLVAKTSDRAFFHKNHDQTYADQLWSLDAETGPHGRDTSYTAFEAHDRFGGQNLGYT